MLSLTEALHLLDCDESDDNDDIDVEDEEVPANNVATSENEHNTVEFVDPDAILPEPVEDNLPIWDMNFKWSIRFPRACSINEAAPSGREWGKFQLEYDSLPSECRIFEDTCQLDSLLDEILIPQSILYMHLKGKPFEIEKGEMRACIGINIMMSHNEKPKIHDYFSTEPDLRVDPIAEAMTRDRFYAIRTALHFANNLECPEKSDSLHDRAWKIRPLIIHFNKAFQVAMSQLIKKPLMNG